MKKALVLMFVLMLTLSLSTLVMAVDVNVDGTDVASTTIDFNVDGFLNINAQGIDGSTFHPGQVGNENSFHGVGSFLGTYSVSQGLYGGLGAYINVDSKSPAAASFEFDDYQNFNVLSGNHTYNVESYFIARASGTTTPVAMNLKTAGSMYVWSEATDPYSKDPLRGNYIEKYASVDVGDVTQAELNVWVNTTGSATMHNSNIWGWGINEHGNVSTNYGGGTREVSATGAGTFGQGGQGANSFSYSGSYTFPGGGGFGTGTGYFNDGFSGTYQMSGN